MASHAPATPTKPAPNVPVDAQTIGEYDTDYERVNLDDNMSVVAVLKSLRTLRMPVYVTVSDTDGLRFYAIPGTALPK